MPLLAAQYAELVKRDPSKTPASFTWFFERTLLRQPFADPDIPSLVYEDRDAGPVGFLGSHLRPVRFGDRRLVGACFGPVLVAADQRRRGIATELLRRYLAGPQDLTFNDRSIDVIHKTWMSNGGITDLPASIGWSCTLAPLGHIADTLSNGRFSRKRLPGGKVLSAFDTRVAARLIPQPSEGDLEPLSQPALTELLLDIGGQAELVPDYDEAYLSWLFATMEATELGDLVLRRLVRAEDGSAGGAYVTLVRRNGPAHLVQFVARRGRAGLVFDHLAHDAAAHGAVSLGGRIEPGLVPVLRSRRCRLVKADWAGFQARDSELSDAVLRGRARLSRMDGEWWMRPK